MEEENKKLRFDYTLILEMIEPNSRVLDLGCGDGTLLSELIKQKGCKGTGIEIDEDVIYQCIEKGVTVTHDDFDTGLDDYSDKRFDYVILNESVQEVLHPQKVILEALRVGKKAIVGIPNFCHYKARLQVFFTGKAPVTKDLPHEWYNTPNLRFLSIKDFRHFCQDNGIKVLKEIGIADNRVVTFRPNVFANIGLFLLEK